MLHGLQHLCQYLSHRQQIFGSRLIFAESMLQKYPFHGRFHTSNLRYGTWQVALALHVLIFCCGYWQLPLEEGSQAYHSLVTPLGIFKPTRTLQSGSNCVANFQSRIEPCFAEMRKVMKALLDDFILYTKTEYQLLDSLKAFFRICRERRLKISSRKSVLWEN